jgi:GT2 family glycosyltransferase/2-polyprenyl-3-methyl-5-hydroxy-6-metoxy-1,4-benzoquinol methylase/glycosyltransferase involved in cell wall biosynthesis
MPRLTVVKVWYQNDFGRYARRDERLARALLDDPRVGRVIHLEPPLARVSEPPAGDRRHRDGAREGELRLFTPTFAPGAANPWREVLEATARFLAANGVFDEPGDRGGPALLWVSAPGAFGDQLIATMGARFRWIVAELEDDHRLWCAPRSEEQLQVERRYVRAARASDLLVSNSAALLEEFRRFQPSTKRVANAVDLAEFERAEAAGREPACLAGVGRPRLAYVGNLRLRLRQDLLAAVADAHPQATLLLAGDGGDALAATLGTRRNVRFVGRLAPAEVPSFLLASDVLLLPHATGAITDAMDPQKLVEYLASGRPIVATPVAGARERAGLVALADDARGFVAAVGAALREVDPVARERRRGSVRGNTWQAAAASVLDAALAAPAPGARLRSEQELGYFQHDRPEVRALVPETARSVLDVGCGAGALGAALKFRRDVEVVGIELDPRAAKRAAESLDGVREGDALARMKELEGEGQRFDAILFADLLEHLPRPEQALALARELLAPGGVVIASLPNVRHWSVVRQLLEGEFRYEPAGILDRTHLRFFTKRSAQRLLEEQGFEVARVAGARWAEEGMPAEVAAALERAGVAVGSLVEESREHQWLFVARPRDEGLFVARPRAASKVAATPSEAASSAALVSVIVPVCNAADYTRACLDELRERGGGGLDVIVVDNGSSDATREVLAAHPEVRVIRNAENRGFAGAVNQGLAEARAPLVVVLNNDTLLTEGWLAPMVRLLEREPSIALVGPCTSYAKGRQQVDLTESLSGGPRPLADHDEMRALAASWCERERGRVEDASFLSGFCFAGRTAELRQLGGLADAYGKGTFEDDELCRRLRRAGRRLAIARDSYVHHFGNRTFRALGVDLAAQQAENWKRFAARHGEDAGLHARVAALQERWGDVLRLALAGVKQSPADLDSLWLAALAAARLGRRDDALRLLDRYVARAPFDPEASALRRDLDPGRRCDPARDSESRSEHPPESRNELPGEVAATT